MASFRPVGLVLTDGAARKAGLSSRKGTQCTPQTLSLSSSCFFTRNVKGQVTNKSRKGHETKFIDEFCWVKIAFRQIVVLPGDITCDIWTCCSHFCRQTASLIAAVMYKAGPRCLTTSYRPGNDMLPQCLLCPCWFEDRRRVEQAVMALTSHQLAAGWWSCEVMRCYKRTLSVASNWYWFNWRIGGWCGHRLPMKTKPHFLN